ncbi:hypothetical protein M3Y96_01196200 [Aphelenchoides besseyi]|nr:hypothetical protein M3Y96_01196200 [Aphelenchoides besseyi]
MTLRKAHVFQLPGSSLTFAYRFLFGRPNRIITPLRSPLGRPSRSTTPANANQVQESKSSDSNRSNSLEDTKQNETVDAPSPAHKRSSPRQPYEPEAAEEKDPK